MDTLHGVKPEQPDEAWLALNRLQTRHWQQRQALESTIRQNIRTRRAKYFRSHRYDFEAGKAVPRAVVGPEFEEQKQKREDYEALHRLELLQQQRAELDSFLGTKARLVKATLVDHDVNLVQPAFQKELQTLLVSVKKECFQIMQEQERQAWLQDVPLDESQKQSATSDLLKLKELEDLHITTEEKSPEVQRLIEVQRQIVATKRQELSVTRLQRTQADLKKPEFLRREMAGPVKIELDQVLPAYLVTLLRELGITRI